MSDVAFAQVLRRVSRLIVVRGGSSTLTPAGVCVAAGTSREVFDTEFGSVAGVLAALGDSVRGVHRTAIGATLRRRRSVNLSLQSAMDALLDTVEAHLDQHLAVLVLFHQPLSRTDNAGPQSLHQELANDMCLMLTRIGEDHDVTWDEPVDRLARMSVATLNGLIVDRAARKDPAHTRKLVRIHAYQLASHATRNRPGAVT